MALERISLINWKFNLGEEMICPEQAAEVSVPHTWNVEEGTEDYWGTGWYGYTFIPEEDWKNKRVQILFHAVYHDACVWLNGEEVVCHQNSGAYGLSEVRGGESAFGEGGQSFLS